MRLQLLLKNFFCLQQQFRQLQLTASTKIVKHETFGLSRQLLRHHNFVLTGRFLPSNSKVRYTTRHDTTGVSLSNLRRTRALFPFFMMTNSSIKNGQLNHHVDLKIIKLNSLTCSPHIHYSLQPTCQKHLANLTTSFVDFIHKGSAVPIGPGVAA